MTMSNDAALAKLDSIELLLLKSRIKYLESEIGFYQQLLDLHKEYGHCWESK